MQLHDFLFSLLPTSLIATIYLALEWFLRLLALVVVPRRRPPTSGAAWLLAIFLFPPVGWLLFIFLGNFKLPKSRRTIQAKMNHRIDRALREITHTNPEWAELMDPKLPSKYETLETLTQEYGHLPSFSGNYGHIIDDYEESLRRIAADIRSARHSVAVEFFAMTFDDFTKDFFDALKSAHSRGVEVRVLFDTFGSLRYRGRRKMIKFLKANGIAYKQMLPLHFPGKGYVRPDLRNHRKIVIIDNEIGYTGSQNIIERHYQRRDKIYYDELVVRLTGPIVVELAALFATDWVSEGGEEPTFFTPELPKSPAQSHHEIMQLLPSGPGFKDENNLRVFTHLIHLAQKSITIVNPYFVPPAALLGAILSASDRGVKVRLINSRAIDQIFVGYAQRSYYETLFGAGVEIFLYDAPILLHSKFIVVDNEVTIVGSSNLDMRSFQLDCELSLLSYDPGFSNRMEQVAHTYLKTSQRLLREEWSRRPFYKKVLENVARLTAAVQ